MSEHEHEGEFENDAEEKDTSSDGEFFRVVRRNLGDFFHLDVTPWHFPVYGLQNGEANNQKERIMKTRQIAAILAGIAIVTVVAEAGNGNGGGNGGGKGRQERKQAQTGECTQAQAGECTQAQSQAQEQARKQEQKKSRDGSCAQ